MPLEFENSFRRPSDGLALSEGRGVGGSGKEEVSISYSVQSWGVQCPPKAQVAKGLVSSLQNLQELGPTGRKLGRWGHTLEGDIGTPSLSLFLLTSHHEVGSSSNLAF